MRGYHIHIVLNTSKEQKQNNHIPHSIFDRLPSQPTKPTNRRNATFNPHKKDYRFGPIRIDWLDRSKMNPSSLLGKEKEGASGMLSIFWVEKLAHRIKVLLLQSLSLKAQALVQQIYLTVSFVYFVILRTPQPTPTQTLWTDPLPME